MEKHIKISTEAEQILLKLQTEKELHSTSAAIEYLIKEYERNNDLTKRISEKVTEDLSKILTRIRLGTNTADINSQVIIEILNAIIFKLNVDPMTTGFQETPTVTISREYVRGNIAKYKQNKDQRTNK